MMIKPEEIRVGIYVGTSNGAFEQLQESNDIDFYGDDKEWNPIPITPEWLDKLGGTQHYEDQPELWQIGLFVFKLHDQYGLCQWDQEGQCIIFGTIHYKYVHQLQNLYFALTGEELTIKE